MPGVQERVSMRGCVELLAIGRSLCHIVSPEISVEKQSGGFRQFFAKKFDRNLAPEVMQLVTILVGRCGAPCDARLRAVYHTAARTMRSACSDSYWETCAIP